MIAGFRRPALTARGSVAWYTLPRLLSRLAAFALLPVYTRVLTPAEFGLAALALAVSGVIRLVIAPGMEGIYLRYAYRGDGEQYRKMSTILRVHLPFLAVATAVLWMLGERISALLMPGAPLSFYYAVLGAIALESLSAPMSAAWRAQHRADKLAVMTIAHTVIQVTVILIGLLAADLGGLSILLGEVAASAALVPVYMRPVVQAISAGFDRDFLRGILPGIVAVVPEAFATWALSGFERVLLNLLHGAEQVGLYASGYQIGAALMFVALILNKEWQPLIFEHAADSPPHTPVLQRLWTHAIVLFLLLGSALALAAAAFAGWVLGDAYASGAVIVPIVALAGVVRVPALLLAHACWARSQLGTLTIANALAVGAFVVSGLVLIPRFGVIGAAWTAVIGQAVIVAYVFAQRWNFFRFDPQVTVWVAVFFAAWAVALQERPLLTAAAGTVVLVMLLIQARDFWVFLGELRPRQAAAEA